jgi:hypothetical protein
MFEAHHTINATAANGGSEPRVSDAAKRLNGSIGDFFQVLVLEVGLPLALPVHL